MATSTLTEASQKSKPIVASYLGEYSPIDYWGCGPTQILPKQRGRTMQGYKKWITGEWQPGCSDNQKFLGQFLTLTIGLQENGSLDALTMWWPGAQDAVMEDPSDITTGKISKYPDIQYSILLSWHVTTSIVYWSTLSYLLLCQSYAFKASPCQQSVTFRFRNFSVLKLFHFLDGFRFVIERIWNKKSVGLGIEKNIGFSIGTIWFWKKKGSDSVSFILGILGDVSVSKLCHFFWRFRIWYQKIWYQKSVGFGIQKTLISDSVSEKIDI